MRRRQWGLSGIELLISIAIIGIVTGTLALGYQEYVRERAGNDVASALKRVQTGVYSLIQSSNGLYITASPVPGLADPLAPTVAELAAIGAMPAGSTANAPGGRQVQIRIRRVPVGCSTTPPLLNCDLDYIVYLDGPIRNPLSNRVDDTVAGRVVLNLGALGGASSTENPTVISGRNGGWTYPNPNGAVGGVVALFESLAGSNFDRYLPRDGSLPITGNLNFAGNSALNINQISFQNPGAAAGSACTGSGTAITRGSGGEGLLSCIGGVWRPIVADAYVTAGAGCTTPGAIGWIQGTDPAVSAQCVNGAWRLSSDLQGGVVMRGITVLTDGGTVAKPTCGSGMSPAAFAMASSASAYYPPPAVGSPPAGSNQTGSFQFQMVDLGASYQLRVLDGTGTPISAAVGLGNSGSATVVTFCAT